MSSALVTSADGRWAAARRGRVISVLSAGAGPVRAQLELPTEDVELAWVGSPPMLAVTALRATPPMMALYTADLAPIAQLELAAHSQVITATGQRVVLSADARKLVLVRATPKSLVGQTIDPGAPFDLVVGLDREQLLIAVARRLEIWDSAAGRPALRLNLPLPPMPRVAGHAQGHLWVFQPGGEEVFIYRLSDGRPFRHHAYAPITAVVSHPLSPLVVIVTPRGLVRLHCTAHSLVLVDSPWVPDTALAMLAVGEDITLLGLAPGADDSVPWRAVLATSAASSATAGEGDEPVEAKGAAAEARAGIPDSHARLIALTARAAGGNPVEPARSSDPVGGSAPGSVAASASDAQGPTAARPELVPTTDARGARGSGVGAGADVGAGAGAGRESVVMAAAWSPRDPTAAFAANWRAEYVDAGLALAAGGRADRLPRELGGELRVLADRWRLGAGARRALGALYALHVVGAAPIPVAQLAHALGDWPDALGQGELGERLVVRHRHGKVALREAAASYLDGRAPGTVRFVGERGPPPRPGLYRLARGTATDVEIEAELAARIGRLAIPLGGLARGLLEARLHGATALVLSSPPALPWPMARDAPVIFVHDGAPPSWLARFGPLPMGPRF